MSVSLTMEGPARPLSEGAELAAYRAVQESLTNTRKHGGLAVAAAVTLRYEQDELLVRVTDDGRRSVPAAGEGAVPAAGEGAGHGLTGMRERIAMYGGTVQAGPLADGGYQVSARLPFAGTAERPDAAGPGAAEPGAELADEARRQGDAA
jgi:signal transduction histidine kinase